MKKVKVTLALALVIVGVSFGLNSPSVLAVYDTPGPMTISLDKTV